MPGTKAQKVKAFLISLNIVLSILVLMLGAFALWHISRDTFRQQAPDQDANQIRTRWLGD